MTIHIDILNIRRFYACTRRVIGNIFRIVWLVEFGNSNGHTLALETLLVKLVDLIGGRQLIARQRRICSILATASSCYRSAHRRAEWRFENGQSEVIESHH